MIACKSIHVFAKHGGNVQMLADFLNNVREQAVREAEQRANTIEGPGLLPAGLTTRRSVSEWLRGIAA